MDIVEELYRLTQGFPREERYGLTQQMRRAAISVPANIAEGWGRRGTKEFLQFLKIASGSLRELETYLVLAQRIGLVSAPSAQGLLDLIQQTSRQLLQLQRRLNKA